MGRRHVDGAGGVGSGTQCVDHHAALVHRNVVDLPSDGQRRRHGHAIARILDGQNRFRVGSGPTQRCQSQGQAVDGARGDDDPFRPDGHTPCSGEQRADAASKREGAGRVRIVVGVGGVMESSGTPLSPTARTTLRRNRTRSERDRSALVDVLDAARICHLGVMVHGTPLVVTHGVRLRPRRTRPGGHAVPPRLDAGCCVGSHRGQGCCRPGGTASTQHSKGVGRDQSSGGCAVRGLDEDPHRRTRRRRRGRRGRGCGPECSP